MSTQYWNWHTQHSRYINYAVLPLLGQLIIQAFYGRRRQFKQKTFFCSTELLIVYVVFGVVILVLLVALIAVIIRSATNNQLLIFNSSYKINNSFIKTIQTALRSYKLQARSTFRRWVLYKDRVLIHSYCRLSASEDCAKDTSESTVLWRNTPLETFQTNNFLDGSLRSDTTYIAKHGTQPVRLGLSLFLLIT